MTDDVKTTHDTDTTEHLMVREPEILSEEPLFFEDGEITTRSELESGNPATEKADSTDTADKGEQKSDDSVETLRAQLEHERNAKRAARRAERRLKQELSDLRQAGSKPGEIAETADNKEPKWEDFDDPNEWMSTWNKWKDGTKQPEQAEKSSPALAPDIAAAIADVRDAEEHGVSKYPDYRQVVYSNEAIITDSMVLAIAETDAPEDVTYYLGKNLDEARRIASLDPRGVLREVAKIEARIAAGTITLNAAKVETGDIEVETGDDDAPAERIQVKRPTAAPAPMKTVDGGGSPKTKPDELSQEQYEKWRMSQRR